MTDETTAVLETPVREIKWTEMGTGWLSTPQGVAEIIANTIREKITQKATHLYVAVQLTTKPVRSEGEQSILNNSRRVGAELADTLQKLDRALSSGTTPLPLEEKYPGRPMVAVDLLPEIRRVRDFLKSA